MMDSNLDKMLEQERVSHILKKIEKHEVEITQDVCNIRHIQMYSSLSLSMFGSTNYCSSERKIP